VTTPAVFKDAREWGELVARVWSGDAPAEIVPPGIILAVDRPEWAALRGEVPWHHTGGAGPTAAVFAFVGITQPDPTRMTVVEAIWITNEQAVAQGYRIGMVSPPAIAGATKAASRDLRRLTVTTSLTVGTQAGDQLPSVKQLLVPATTSLVLKIERGWMIRGNNQDGVLVQSNLVNASAFAIFFGYERRARPEEIKID
jgi:hypothetical protein